MKMQKRLFAGALAVAMAILPTGQIFAADEWNVNITEEEKNYIVVLREETKDVVSFLSELECAESYSDEIREEFSGQSIQVLPLTEQEAAELALDERVVSVEEDVVVRAMENVDDTIDNLVISMENEYEWNLEAVHATPEELAQYSTDESVIKVAVLDSGTCVIEDIEVQEYINIVAEEQDITDYYADGTGHGTAVAGIIAAKDDNEGIIGIAPGVELYSVKVFDWTNEAPVSRIIEGIYWAIDHDIDILNMSFGTTVNSYALHQAIQDAYAAGILMVAAAGNGGQVEYPAAYNEVIAVGAIDYQGNRAEFSATGESLELMAPGVCVLSDSFFGGVMAVSGTSVAAPHVVGAAAILWAKDISKSSDFIRQLLNASANSNYTGTVEEYGNGILDVKHAFEIYEEFEAAYEPGVCEYAGITENRADYIVSTGPEYVVGSWGDTEHSASIQMGSTIDSSIYTANSIAIMQWMAKQLDVDFAAERDNSSIHAGRAYGSRADQEADNYVNDLIFLYELAIALKGMSATSNETAQKAMVDTVAARVSKRTGVAIKSGFIAQVKSIISYTDESTLNDPDSLKTAPKNAYKILGTAIHLAGDIYAHRSMLPTTAVNSTVTQSTSSSITGDYFNLNHFDEGTTCTLAKIAETAYNIHQSVDMCHDNTWQCFKYGVQNGVMEFKDINTWTNVTSRGKYEDNAKFYNQRYSVGTNYTVRYLMQKYSENASTLDEKVLLPGVNGRTYSLQLNNLKGNYQAVGFSWSNSWSRYTTDNIK